MVPVSYLVVELERRPSTPAGALTAFMSAMGTSTSSTGPSTEQSQVKTATKLDEDFRWALFFDHHPCLPIVFGNDVISRFLQIKQKNTQVGQARLPGLNRLQSTGIAEGLKLWFTDRAVHLP